MQLFLESGDETFGTFLLKCLLERCISPQVQLGRANPGHLQTRLDELVNSVKDCRSDQL
jgi:hypothetical protein